MNEEINKALGELYEDLDKLKNARIQVESITNTNEKLMNSIKNYWKSIEDFSDWVRESNEKNIAEFKSNLIEFESESKQLLLKSNEQINNHLEEIETISLEKIENLNEFSINIKSNINQSIEESKRIAIDSINNQEKAVLGTLEKIENLNSHIENVVDLIRNNIKEKFNYISSELDLLKENNIRANKLNKVVLALLGINILISLILKII